MNVKSKKGNAGIVLVFFAFVIIIVVVTISSCFGCDCGSSELKDETCPICHRTFDGYSENAKSIRRRNMCENCYNNYK